MKNGLSFASWSGEIHISKGTVWNEGGNQAQGRKVEYVRFLTCAFAATCEQTSPSPAIQLQWAHTASPFSLTATHTFKEVSDSLCECFT